MTEIFDDGNGGMTDHFISLVPPHLRTADHALTVAGGHRWVRWDRLHSEPE